MNPYTMTGWHGIGTGSQITHTVPVPAIPVNHDTADLPVPMLYPNHRRPCRAHQRICHQAVLPPIHWSAHLRYWRDYRTTSSRLQMQRTFSKSVSDPSSILVCMHAADV